LTISGAFFHSWRASALPASATHNLPVNKTEQ
jgi:hypothetical protein